MRNNILEAVTGFVVLIVTAFFLIFIYQNSGEDFAAGVVIKAKFDRIDGINVGSDVKISGVKVGTVKAYGVDPKTYQAIVVLNVKKQIKIPRDSSAKIISESLLGGKYISISPGIDKQNLSSGGVIVDTQSSINLESLIAKFIFSDKK